MAPRRDTRPRSAPRADGAREPFVRPVRDRDSLAVIELIAAVFAEYPGCVLDVLQEEPDLLAPATAFRRKDGRMWVAERLEPDAAGATGRVVGSVAVVPTERHGVFELKKLYVAKEERGRGLGGRLLELVEDEVRRRGGRIVELWSDTRFTVAHGVYERRGYRRDGRERELFDRSATVEHYFSKRVR